MLSDLQSPYGRGSEEKNYSALAGNRTPVIQSTPSYFLSRPIFKLCVDTVVIGKLIFAVVLATVVMDPGNLSMLGLLDYAEEYQTGILLMHKPTFMTKT
jgi:hypothetical protein